ncbi:MAG: T9SS type A sorting domain-containing protein [Flavobacterium sp.]|nr:T9SS type A sorting domain-containing protein [Flavobacterium sp.]
MYFPPINSTATWETTDPVILEWCPERINNLYAFLEQENTKGFIVLKDGKIVLEQYFGTFTSQSLWYWASAGKTITSFLVGKAQEENLLNINDRTSNYLGAGWTNCTLAQENNITIKNQLTMTSGLDDGVIDDDCTDPICLEYIADAGTRWAYHNAPYTLLDDVLQNATTANLNTYTQLKLKNPTGMTGGWTTIDYNNVYFSTVRSMARFGLLIHGNGVWNGNQLINPNYFSEMVNTSQNLNKSYGYLWWLNGKPNYMLPTTQLIFPGSYAPNAPTDMIAGLGKDGQIVSISQSSGLVFVRMGEAPSSTSSVPTLFCNQIWQKINELNCNLSIETPKNNAPILYPNPTQNQLHLAQLRDNAEVFIYNLQGLQLMRTTDKTIDVSDFSAGIYLITIRQNDEIYSQKWIKR